MAKHGKSRRKMGRYIRGNVDESQVLTTLAGRTLVSSAFDDVVDERSLISSIVATYSLEEYTDITSAGPVMVGIAHSDYSSAEIEEVIENTGSWSEGDLVSREIGARKVKIIGVFQQKLDTPLERSVLNVGKPIKTKLNWILNQGQSLQLWGFNLGTVAFATTVPIIRVQGHANLWPGK